MIEKEVLKNVEDSIFNYNNEPAIETGFYELDEMLQKTNNSSLIVIGARCAMGKTAFATNIMLNLLKNKKKCLYFSLEISKEAITQRLIVQECEIDSKLMRQPELLQDTHKVKIKNELDTISKYDLIIDDTCVITLEKIKEKIETNKPEYVFIDYLQCMDVSDKKSVSAGITELITGLKQIAKENKCMIFILSQLPLAVENRINKRPILSDLKEYGTLAEMADVVLFLYRDAFYNMVSNEKNDETEIIVAKNKIGAIGTFKLIFKGSIIKYFNP